MLEEDEKAFGGNGGKATQMDDIFDELSKLSQVILDNFGSVPSIGNGVPPVYKIAQRTCLSI